MRAVVWKGPHSVEVQDVKEPQIQEDTDAILKLTSTAICGSDLHMYEGRTSAKPGTVFGHENLGVIEEVGKDVKTFKAGDRVVVPFNISCGFCFNCTRGYTSACLVTNPEMASAAYGYADMGPYKGGQAEYVRVPYADFNCLALPGTPGDSFEDDFICLADIFPTGYYGTDLAQVGPGDTVAIFGAGPVGLMSVISSSLRGASEIYVVDKVPERLSKAAELGAIPIDFSKGDPVEQIFSHRSQSKVGGQKLRPGSEKMPGVDCAIDAVGYEAIDRSDLSRQNPSQVLQDISRVTNPTGRVGIVGVYLAQDPGGVNDEAKQGNFTFPLGKMFSNGLSIGMGQAPVKRYNSYLRDLIVANKAHPGTIISHHLPLDAAPEAYADFGKRGDGYTKIILKPQAA